MGVGLDFRAAEETTMDLDSSSDNPGDAGDTTGEATGQERRPETMEPEGRYGMLL